jgi:hypothetical protein
MDKSGREYKYTVLKSQVESERFVHLLNPHSEKGPTDEGAKIIFEKKYDIYNAEFHAEFKSGQEVGKMGIPVTN